jgi:hypothetical protein
MAFRDYIKVKGMYPGMYGGYYKQTYRSVQCRCGQWIQNYGQMKHIRGYNHSYNMWKLQREGKLPPPMVKVPPILSIEKLLEFKEF